MASVHRVPPARSRFARERTLAETRRAAAAGAGAADPRPGHGGQAGRCVGPDHRGEAARTAAAANSGRTGQTHRAPSLSAGLGKSIRCGSN